PEALVPHLRPGTAIELLPTDPAYLADSGVRARVLEVVPSRAGTSALGGTAAGTAEALVTLERSRAGEVAHALVMGDVVVTVIDQSPSPTAPRFTIHRPSPPQRMTP